MPLRRSFLALFLVVGCGSSRGDGQDFGLSKGGDSFGRTLRVGQRVPDTAEQSAVGPFVARVHREGRSFAELVSCEGSDVVFKDEEGTGADRMMTGRLCEGLRRLAVLVKREWPDVRLRVTEAWDERREHARTSVHYEGRAADITTSDVDPSKLGRVARLAVDARLDWVFYEDATHVHVSAQRGK